MNQNITTIIAPESLRETISLGHSPSSEHYTLIARGRSLVIVQIHKTLR
jgi:hypothetical protein